MIELEVAKNRTRSSYRFLLTYRTRWSDNDQYSHMNNSIYYHLFDSIINTYLIEHCGLSPSSQDDNLIGLVVSSHCQFFAPLSFPQVLELGLRTNKIGKSSIEYEVGVFAEGEQAVSAVGGYTHVFVEKNSRKPMKDGMGGPLRECLTKLLMHDSFHNTTQSKL